VKTPENGRLDRLKITQNIKENHTTTSDFPEPNKN
jgi:hypothetical protein